VYDSPREESDPGAAVPEQTVARLKQSQKRPDRLFKGGGSKSLGLAGRSFAQCRRKVYAVVG